MRHSSGRLARASTGPGGSGLIFIEDIGCGKPAAVERHGRKLSFPGRQYGLNGAASAACGPFLNLDRPGQRPAGSAWCNELCVSLDWWGWSSVWSGGERSEPERKTDDSGDEKGYVLLISTPGDKEIRTHETTALFLTTERHQRQGIFWSWLDRCVNRLVVDLIEKALEAARR